MNIGLWYYLFFMDVRSFNQLVFIDYVQLFYFDKYVIIKIWYGEDLMDFRNYNNRGRVCVYVWVYFM